MILSRSRLKVADNSGPVEVRCIRVLATNRRYGNIGDTIVVSVQKNHTDSKFKKGQVMRGIIIRTRKGIKRPNGSILKFNDNAVILLNHQHNLIGNRISGEVPRELRAFKQLKILSLSETLV
jgi:large subunit ribosomal protein L14